MSNEWSNRQSAAVNFQMLSAKPYWCGKRLQPDKSQSCGLFQHQAAKGTLNPKRMRYKGMVQSTVCRCQFFGRNPKP